MDPFGLNNPNFGGNNNFPNPYSNVFNDKGPGGVNFPNPLGGFNDLGPFPPNQMPRPNGPVSINGNLLGRNNFNNGPGHIRYDPITPFGPRFDFLPPQDNTSFGPPGFNQMKPPSFNGGIGPGFNGGFI